MAESKNESSRAASVHHVVFAVPPEQLPEAVQLFSELGFRFETIELEDVGLRVLLDWDGGLELVTPLSPGAEGAGAVAQFLQHNGFAAAVQVGKYLFKKSHVILVDQNCPILTIAAWNFLGDL